MRNGKSLCLTALMSILLSSVAAQKDLVTDNGVPGQRLVTETAVIIFAVPLPSAVDEDKTQFTQTPIPVNTHHRLDVVSGTQPDAPPPGSQSGGNPEETQQPGENPEIQPDVQPSDSQPIVTQPEPLPSVLDPVINPDPSPSVVVPIVNPDLSPSVVNPDPSPSVVVPVVDPDPSPSVVVPVINPDPSPSVVIPDPSHSEILPEPTEAAKPSGTINPSGVPESIKPAEPECSTTPPECTKTLSYIELDNKFTSTVFGDCPGLIPAVDCVVGEQSTTTTTIVPEITVASNIDDLSGEEPVSADDDFEKDDNDIKDYLEKQFEDAGISHQDELILEADIQCKDGDVQIPSSCFERIYPAFCSEQAQDPSQKLVKAYLPSDAKSEAKRSYRAALHQRRIETRDDECKDLFIKFAWIPGSGNCDLNCTTVMKTFEGQCILDGGQSWAEIGIGCGQYAIVPAKASAAPPAPTTSTSVAPTQPTAKPKEPFQVNPIVCKKEDNYPNHDDIQKSDQAEFAKQFCDHPVSMTMGRIVNSNLGKRIGPGEELDQTYVDNYGVAYRYIIRWNDGCTTDVDKQSIQKPVDGDTWTCENLMTSAFNGCGFNHGVGGYLDAGCLRYIFGPGAHSR